ncbi:hypothetical protein NGF19_13595 [Streptomyces sp. RY43-2]|uniref:DUF4232 domain-containing protein n=1 Tax=Streptomyces macrolidinus TaxID=2952607 RepID=A0ABT0ZE22_9ACTN|nr:hypothetical protein [Streptomyces macrolidinus]MCN9241813.1 hypothetical protein [Streptomyces macrolidinus]
MSGNDERRGSSRGRCFHERHEPYAWHEPTNRPEPCEDDEQHAGNGTVNHRPEDQARPEAGADHAATAADTDLPGAGGEGLTAGRNRLAAVLGGPGAAGPEPGDDEDAGAAPEGLGSDELALRRMLHDTVGGIEPREGTLEYLRRAVPARRARKRQAVIGMAAAALFIGTAIPAFVHVSHRAGDDADPSIAGHATQAQEHSGKGKGDSDSGSSGSAGTSGTTADKEDKDHPKGKDEKDKGEKGEAGGGADPTASAQSASACTAGQLGNGVASEGGPDAAGTVYGTFRVTNTSTTSCTVSSAGSVFAVAQGSADPSRISVLNHVSGDAASALPEPSRNLTSLVLPPKGAYEVKFAWVPSEACSATGGTGGGTGGTGGEEGGGGVPSPDPTPTSSSSTGDDTVITQTEGMSPQLMREEGAADGSVVVSHTPATGSATARATIPNACAGTVYRTGILTAE